MTARQPFTRLCQTLAKIARPARADLHVHTTASDGLYTPAEVVDLARRAGLAAVALTDHDTLAGVGPAREAAAPWKLAVIAGVEITTGWQSRELHLLAYFVDPGHQPLGDALAELRQDRAQRFHTMVGRLNDMGVSLNVTSLSDQETLGRRHLAELLVAQKKAATVHEAFQRYLKDEGRINVPKLHLPVERALDLVHQAGGVGSWAHPAGSVDRPALAGLKAVGLDAVEADFPSAKAGRRRELRTWAGELGLAITAGSDCHGPGQAHRSIGSCTVTDDELTRLRAAMNPSSSFALQ